MGNWARPPRMVRETSQRAALRPEKEERMMKLTKNLSGRHVAASLLGGLLLLQGCGTGSQVRLPGSDAESVASGSAQRPEASRAKPDSERPQAVAPHAAEASMAGGSGDQVRIYRGSGKTVLPARANLAEAEAKTAGEEVSLNFDGADVREVVKTILTDILNEAYLFDPQVNGVVTLRTTKPIARGALIATLETVLRMNGAALVKEAGIFRIVPVAQAVRGVLTPQLGTSGQPLPQGFSVRLVPLKYVGVREMARILDPFVKDAASMRADDLRNMLVLFGTERELQHLVNTIEMFDVDWMSGMSVGIFTLRSAEVKTVYGEIEKIMGDKNVGPLAGLLRIIPIERLNALLVISPQPHYLEQAKIWVERLDKGGDSGGARIFVYQVQNGRAEKLAALLTQAFTGRAPSTTTSAPTLAPGQTPATISSTPAQPGAPASKPAAPASPVPQAAAGPGGGLVIAKNVSVIADKDNNALLIMANPAEYALIESAVKKLDIAPRQVMIDVVIAEVTLSDGLDLGLQGYFRHGDHFQGSLLTGTSGTLGTIAPGFSYLWKPGGALGALAPGGVAGAFGMTASDSRVKVISRPNILATDHQKAQIQIGQRVPTTSQSQTVSGTTTGIINSVQYLDTGILLSVTPHINAGGLVALELNAEVSKAVKNSTSGIDSPVITRTTAQSTITAQSGETMVMGGLISEDKTQESSGLPFISEIPVLGAIFGKQSRSTKRTEMVMFITPRVISSDHQLRDVMDELRGKMSLLEGVFPAPQAVSGAQAKP